MRAVFLWLLLLTTPVFAQEEPVLLWETHFFRFHAPPALGEKAEFWRIELELARQDAIDHWTRPLNTPVDVYLWPPREWNSVVSQSTDLHHALAFVRDRGRHMAINHERMLSVSPARRRAALVHEYTHVYLGQMLDAWPSDVQPRQLPRWYNEGLAIAVADEAIWFDIARLDLLGPDQMIPLLRLANDFPSEQDRQRLAYQESADVVRLIAEQHTDLRALIDHIVSPVTGPTHVANAWGRETVEGLEREWHQTLRVGLRWLLIVTSGGFLWGVAMVLAFFAWLRKRRLARQKVNRWAMEAEGLVLGDADDDEYSNP